MTRRGFFARLLTTASASIAAARIARAMPKPMPAPVPYRCPSLSVRMIRQYNAASDRYITRLDVLYGMGIQAQHNRVLSNLADGVQFRGLPMPAHPAPNDPGAF